MGSGSSALYVPPTIEQPSFAALMRWPLSRAEAIVARFQKNDYDFAIGLKDVIQLVGDAEVAEQVFQALRRGTSSAEAVSALVLMSAIIIACDRHEDELRAISDLNEKVQLLLRLFDLNSRGYLSPDELAVALLTVAQAMDMLTSNSGNNTDSASTSFPVPTLQQIDDKVLQILGHIAPTDSTLGYLTDRIVQADDDLFVMLGLLKPAKTATQVEVEVAEPLAPAVVTITSDNATDPSASVTDKENRDSSDKTGSQSSAGVIDQAMTANGNDASAVGSALTESRTESKEAG